jgi:hypothetical protein
MPKSVVVMKPIALAGVWIDGYLAWCCLVLQGWHLEE